MANRVLLSVKRYKQKNAECALGSAASIANFFDPSITYTTIRKTAQSLLDPDFKYYGLYTPEQATLLNQVGFQKITIVTCDAVYDFSWNKLKKSTLIRKLYTAKKYYVSIRNEDTTNYLKCIIKWLSDKKCDNHLIIDSDLSKHIKRHLSSGRPVIVSVNWTKLFQFSKGNWVNKMDIRGEPEDHMFVIRGYDNKGVFIVDSHHKFYTGKREKYKNGYYKISWNKLCTNLSGDVVLV